MIIFHSICLSIYRGDVTKHPSECQNYSFLFFFLHFFFFKFRVFEEGSILSYICLSFEYDQFYLFIEKIFIFILFNFMVYVYD